MPRPEPFDVRCDVARASEAELMARVLGGSPSEALCATAARFASLPFWQRRALGTSGLIREYGVPSAIAFRLAALWELAERWFPIEAPAVLSARDVVLCAGAIRDKRREEVIVLMLDARSRPIGSETIAVGTVNASRLLPRDVFASALRNDAVSVILVHNHPSGDPLPSKADRVVTAAVRRGGELIGVPLVDHVIVAARGHYSFREAEAWDKVDAAA